MLVRIAVGETMLVVLPERGHKLQIATSVAGTNTPVLLVTEPCMHNVNNVSPRDCDMLRPLGTG
jgi:hypothetical protein